jgi:hypothetical protein
VLYYLYQVVTEAAVMLKTVKINVPETTPRTGMLNMLQVVMLMLLDQVIVNALNDFDV